MRLAHLAPVVFCSAALFGGTYVASADTVSFSILGGTVSGVTNGSLMPKNGLFELVDLGPNGAFDPVMAGSWVSGDDRLVALPFASGSQNMDEWLSAAFFDSTDGTGTDGQLNRFFTLALDSGVVSPGDHIGIRWYPTITASNDAGSNPPAAGTPYGQFTRQTTPLHGGVDWVIPSAGQSVSFDPLLTAAYTSNNPDPVSSTLASYLVLVPEPSAWALVLGGFACFGLGRWRPVPKTSL